MKLQNKFTLSSLLLTLAIPVNAQEPYDPGSQYQQQTSTNTQKVAEYLKNLGGYLGYDVTVSPKQPAQLLQETSTNPTSINAIWSYIGAIPVSTFFPALKHFLPTAYPGAGMMNTTFSNNTFKQYGQASTNQISVNPIVDQQPFQQDPVSQAVVNILSTPDYTYCLQNYNSQTWDSKRCPDMLGMNTPNKTNYQIMKNVVGTIPSPQEFFTYTQKDANIFAPLNSNSLIAPLLYDTSTPGSGTSSPGASGQSGSNKQGLTAQNQTDAAANFIRYAAGLATPVDLPSWSDYNDMYSDAVSGNNDLKTNKAQGTLAKYLATLRAYSAQTSVGINNLYFILSKRIAQTAGGGQQAATSQAYNEYQMATWRLFNFGQQNQQQTWKDSINSASEATVQKEIAILLAEINYQMYLSRQQEERVLLTNSMIELLVANMNKPSSNLKQQQQQP